MLLPCMQYSLTRVRRAVSVNTAEGWVYANSVPPAPDEIIINVSAPCQLMGVGLCGTERAFTVVLKVSEVCRPPAQPLNIKCSPL